MHDANDHQAVFLLRGGLSGIGIFFVERRYKIDSEMALPL
jgi:hypothetical protein